MFATISAVCLILFIPWELTRKKPLIDLKMLTGRHFGSCFLVMLATGAILIATTQIVPQLLQDEFGYTATWSGLALSPGGIVTAIMMVVAGRLSGWVPAKWLIVAGALTIAAGMYSSTSLYAGLNFGWFVWQRVYIGVGLPLIFIAITNASYDGLAKDKTDQASALINVARNTGGSIGVAIAQNVLMYREQFHQSRLIEHIAPSNPAYQRALAQQTQLFENRGVGAVEAAKQAFATINQTVQQQAELWAYIDVFVALGFVALSAVPLALLMRATKSAGKVGAA